MSVLTAPVPSLSSRPTSAYPVAPLSVAAHDVDSLLRSGAVAIDIRSQQERDRDGIVLGALAIPADQILDRLIPGSRETLRCADASSRWLLIGVDGHDAEMLTWADHGVAMGHAHAAAISAADEVTIGNNEDGVARVLERWFG